MKGFKVVQIVIWGLVAILLTSVLVAGITRNTLALPFGAIFSGGSSLGDNASYKNTMEFSAADINKVDVDWASGMVTVTGSSALKDKVIVTELANGSLDDNQKAYCKLLNGTLKIDYMSGFSFFFWRHKEIEIQVPETLLDELRVGTASSDIYIAGLNDCSFDSSTASGNISIENSSGNDVKFETASGNLTLTNIEQLNNVKLNSVSGNIDADIKTSDDVKAESVAGNIELKFSENPSRIDANNVSGNINFYLSENDGFKVKFSSVSGDFNCDFAVLNDNNYHVYNNGTNEYDTETVSGDVHIYKN